MSSNQIYLFKRPELKIGINRESIFAILDFCDLISQNYTTRQLISYYSDHSDNVASGEKQYERLKLLARNMGIPLKVISRSRINQSTIEFYNVGESSVFEWIDRLLGWKPFPTPARLDKTLQERILDLSQSVRKGKTSWSSIYEKHFYDKNSSPSTRRRLRLIKKFRYDLISILLPCIAKEVDCDPNEISTKLLEAYGLSYKSTKLTNPLNYIHAAYNWFIQENFNDGTILGTHIHLMQETDKRSKKVLDDIKLMCSYYNGDLTFPESIYINRKKEEKKETPHRKLIEVDEKSSELSRTVKSKTHQKPLNGHSLIERLEEILRRNLQEGEIISQKHLMRATDLSYEDLTSYVIGMDETSQYYLRFSHKVTSQKCRIRRFKVNTNVLTALEERIRHNGENRKSLKQPILTSCRSGLVNGVTTSQILSNDEIIKKTNTTLIKLYGRIPEEGDLINKEILRRSLGDISSERLDTLLKSERFPCDEWSIGETSALVPFVHVEYNDLAVLVNRSIL